jgi:hypothetical protein
MFCKRDSDGVDWYAYINNGASFAPNAIVATVYDNKVTAVVREYDRLFPQGAAVIEITGDNTTDDVQASYGGMMYDATTNTLSPAPPPAAPPEPTKADLMAQLQAIAAALGLTIS